MFQIGLFMRIFLSVLLIFMLIPLSYASQTVEVSFIKDSYMGGKTYDLDEKYHRKTDTPFPRGNYNFQVMLNNIHGETAWVTVTLHFITYDQVSGYFVARLDLPTKIIFGPKNSLPNAHAKELTHALLTFKDTQQSYLILKGKMKKQEIKEDQNGFPIFSADSPDPFNFILTPKHRMLCLGINHAVPVLITY
jgi:hypothetical protein